MVIAKRKNLEDEQRDVKIKSQNCSYGISKLTETMDSFSRRLKGSPV